MKILFGFIYQIVLVIICILLREKMGWLYSIFTLVAFEIWYMLFLLREKRVKKVNCVSNNGAIGAKMFCIIINSILLVYVVELYKNIIVVVLSFFVSCTVLAMIYKDIKNIFFENAITIKTIIVIAAIITFNLDIYAIITMLVPQLHYLHECNMTIQAKIIIIIICIIVSAITLPKNSIIARFSTNNYRNNCLYKDDEDNNNLKK